MSEEEIFEELKKIIVNQFGIDENLITKESTLLDDMGADSLDIVELVMEIEDTFQVEIPDSESENLKTVGDLIKYIQDAK